MGQAAGEGTWEGTTTDGQETKPVDETGQG